MRQHSTDILPADPTDNLWVYCGLDSMITREVFDQLNPLLDSVSNRTYTFSRAMQAPALEMMQRGIRINMQKRSEWISRYSEDLSFYSQKLDQLASAVWLAPLNHQSPAQLKHFFYTSMGLPEQFAFTKGERKVSTNRPSLERLYDYLYARPIVSHILKLRDLSKMLSTLRSGVDEDSRIRASYNVCGTETGRWSSSENAFHTGTNLQNIAPGLREIFISDPGKRLAYVDLEQAESRIVGLLCWFYLGDSTYLDACESGDLHTLVSTMVWPDLPWPGDAKGNKALAKQPFYREFSYRDMAKRGGHGSNYYGTPPTMAKHLKVHVSVMQAFQKQYFTAFNCIRRWHYHVARTLQTRGEITTILGRRRKFLGRLNDDTTLRKAIAFEPQSVVGDLLNQGLYNLWHKHGKTIDVLGQIHDAVLFQYPEHLHKQIPHFISSLAIPITLTRPGGASRTITIPVEAFTGFNWAYESKENPDGLRIYSESDTRTRRYDPALPMLDRVF